MNQLTEVDTIVVGAGFAGLYMLHRLHGMGHRAIALEKGSGVGGTWYWNRYPGARCDVASMEYSYQFDAELQQEWNWSEKYSPQAEILRYANHVADRFELRPHIQFGLTVIAAVFDEAANQWDVTTVDRAGNHALISSTYLICATGCLSSPNKPQLAGMDQFKGSIYHTGEWPHEAVDFSHLNVAVIGTGSSGVQAIPVIAKQANKLTVFQRTANYAVPGRNTPMTAAALSAIKADYPALRKKAATTRNGQLTVPNPQSAMTATAKERADQYEARWHTGGLAFIGSFNDLTINENANKTAADFVRNKIVETVRNPITAQQLSPTSMIGCKRLCVENGYYETYNRSNVSLVDINRTPIESIQPNGIKVNGETIALDAIVFATGYDAMTGALLKMNITGRDGAALKDRWQAGPEAYMGVAMHDFPNLFTITGPGSPSVLTNMLPTIEQHVNLISQFLVHAKVNNKNRIEAKLDAQKAWVRHVNNVASKTIYPGCNSWYLGANVPNKPRVFMPYVGFPDYVKRCEDMVANNFQGFQFTSED